MHGHLAKSKVDSVGTTMCVTFARVADLVTFRVVFIFSIRIESASGTMGLVKPLPPCSFCDL